MRVWEGLVREIHLNPGGLGAWIECPDAAIPLPGQYILCWSPQDFDDPLAHAVFPMDYRENGFLTAPPVPGSWNPGSKLLMRGPSGSSFQLPADCRRLAVVVLEGSVERLYPLIKKALKGGCAVTLCTDPPIPVLPVEVEIFPQNQVRDILPWANYTVLDFPRQQLENVRTLLGSFEKYSGQALVHTPISCGGMAKCGVCTISNSKGTIYTCTDGPVFDLDQLMR